jgi:RHH-type rel operon transcriptional repressor/antitoxin RelB
VTDSVPVTARVAPSIAQRLKALAIVEDRSVSYLIAEALTRYLADEEWQVSEIQAAITEADAADALYVSQSELEAWSGQLQGKPDTPPPAGHSLDDRAPAA